MTENESRTSSAKRIGFAGWVSIVSSAIAIKDKFMPTKRTGAIALEDSDDEGEGTLVDITPNRAAPRTPPPGYSPPQLQLLDSAEDEQAELLPVPNGVSPKPKRKQPCGCCGRRCGYVWQAFFVVTLIYTAIYSWKAYKWWTAPEPMETGLEGLPAFGAYLGCDTLPENIWVDAEHPGPTPNSSLYTVDLPTQSDNTVDPSIYLQLRGDAAGAAITIQYHPISSTSDSVEFEMIMRHVGPELLQRHQPRVTLDGTSQSQALFYLNSGRYGRNGLSGFMCYELVVRIPRGRASYRALIVDTETNAHVKFDLDNDKLESPLFDNVDVRIRHRGSPWNAIWLNASLRAKKALYEVARGWMSGSASIIDSVEVNADTGSRAVLDFTTAPVLELSQDLTSNSTSSVPLATLTAKLGSDMLKARISNPHRQRRLVSTFTSTDPTSELEVRYKDHSEFEGKVTYTAGGNMLVTGVPMDGWIGEGRDEESADMLEVKANGKLRLAM